MKHHSRGRVRRITFLIAAFVVLGGFAAQQYARRVQLERAVRTGYLHAFTELSAGVEQMDNALRKGVYVTTAPMLCSLCDELYAQSKAAQMALGQLPMASETLGQTASFLSTVGDYAYALSRGAALEGKCPGEQDSRNWQALAEAAEELSGRLEELELQLYDGSLDLDDVETAQARLSADQSTAGEGTFRQVEAEFPETPSLIYDGPFSQHLTGKRPEMTAEAPMVEEAAALEAARRFTLWSDLERAGTLEGSIPCYTFTNLEGTRTAQITRQGGLLCTAVDRTAPEQCTLSEKEGVKAARRVLERLGFQDMAESYWQRYDNTLTVNFCYAPEGVRIYPDLVKVSVSLADGSLTGFEAQGYLTNHRPRRLPEPEVEQARAEMAVSTLLTVKGRHLAVIPSRGEHEVLCWEFLCEDQEGGHVITYINALTGAEEKLLLLLEDENGTLAV